MRGLRDIGRTWFSRGGAGELDVVHLALVIGVEEQLVLDDRAADGATKLLVADLLLTGRIEGEEVTRREELAAAIEVGRTMEVVRTGLEAQGDKTACAVSFFCIARGLDGELIDGLNGKGNAGDRTNAALVGSGPALPNVIVVSAIDLEFELVTAGAV